MTYFQKLRLKAWTLWQTVLAFFKGTSKDDPALTEAKAEGKGWLSPLTSLLSLVGSMGGWFQAAFSETVKALSNPYAAGFAVLLSVMSSSMAAYVVQDVYRILLQSAYDEVELLSDTVEIHSKNVVKLAGERAELKAELEAVRAALAEAQKNPAADAPKVVYRTAKTAATQCSSSCILGWSF